MKENETQFTMRMDNAVYEKLKARANRNKRSIAKELEFITEQAVREDEEKLDNILKKIFEEYGKNPESIKTLSDENAQSSLKDAVTVLINYAKGEI